MKTAVTFLALLASAMHGLASAAPIKALHPKVLPEQARQREQHRLYVRDCGRPAWVAVPIEEQLFGRE